jgi:hypothetical protein
MQKVPRSARLAVSEPSRSTQPEEPRIVFAVSMLHTIGGTPTDVYAPSFSIALAIIVFKAFILITFPLACI